MIQDSSSPHLNGYEAFFGFQQTPFSIAPDTRFRFHSASHAAALAQVTYALERREPVVVVTGAIGTGKTLLCRTVVERLERRTFLSIINDPLLDFDSLLKQMLQDFGVIAKDRSKLAPTTRHELIHALQEFLASLKALHAHAVVIIDEAQYVQPEVLEHIRLVSNIHDDRGTMLQIILVGQNDLDQTLSRPELRPFKQRVCRSVPLGALGPAEVEQYIAHRLSVAREPETHSNIPGVEDLAREMAEWSRANSDSTFTPEAVRAVTQLSHGIPRVVNLLCDRALEAAYAQERHAVDASLIGVAAQQLALPADVEPIAPPLVESPQPPSPPPPSPLPLAQPRVAPSRAPTFTARPSLTDRPPALYVIAAGSLVFAALVIWLSIRTMNPPETTPSASSPAVVQPAAVPDAVPPAPAPAVDTAKEAPPSTPVAAPASTGTIGDGFEIVIASFRTESRAASLANDVAALGLPVRQRVASGWQQVLAGPFASVEDAREAQQRLERAGISNTKVAPVTR